MLIEGVIKSYQPDRGFGFIQVEGNQKDLFFHIKDCPYREIIPEVGERVKFEIAEDQQGKLRAIHILRMNIKKEAIRHTPQSRALANEALNRKNKYNQRNRNTKSSSSQGYFRRLMGIVVIVVLGYLVYQKYLEWKTAQTVTSSEVQPVLSQAKMNNEMQQNFKCDGRQHCSQMRSYEEAVFFIRNCPDTKMDGDGDGDPCESQFKSY